MKPVPAGSCEQFSEPRFRKEANYIMGLLRKYRPQELAGLMQTSRKLTDETLEKIIRWKNDPGPDEGDQALLSYAGEVFNGLSARKMNVDDLQFAQDHLRILSAVYGVLRPLDRIQPYRLEMQARLANRDGENLYDFWIPRIRKMLKADVAAGGEPVLVNLASNEYYSATGANTFPFRTVTPRFLESDGKGYRMVTIYAKKARGLMCRFAIENRVEKAEHLKLFDTAGYLFNPDLSGKDEWIFTR